MVDQINIVEPGDNVRVCSGGYAGETGTAIDVVWYSEQSHLCALVRVMSDGGISHFFDLHILEKVKGHVDKDVQFDRAKQTWKYVK